MDTYVFFIIMYILAGLALAAIGAVVFWERLDLFWSKLGRGRGARRNRGRNDEDEGPAA